MKIAILTPTLFKFSGIDRSVELMVKKFHSEGHAVTIFTLASEFYPEGAQIITMGMPKLLFWQRIYRLFFFIDVLKIWKYVHALKEYDVVYSQQYPMNIIAFWAKIFYKKYYIYYNYGIPPLSHFPSFHEKLYIILFSFLTDLTVFNANEVISISKYLHDEFQKRIKKKGSVQYIEIDHSRFYRSISGSSVREKYGIGKDPLILYVGRISPHKGVDLLVQAYNEVLSAIPNAKLIIIGKHTFHSYSKKLKRISGPGIIFAGYVPDEELPPFYAASDVYATASLWEGFDMPLAEAQACGKPVVAFDIGSHPELMRDDQDVLVPVRDIKQFAQALRFKLKP